jgi:quercetin dioxygenase-like cupin family protein
MLIHRWQAEVLPAPIQFKMLLEREGLDPFVEEFPAGLKVNEHRHPFTEVRYVVAGELLFNVAGNQVLLRAGDRIEVPANTKHSHVNNSVELCICIVAQKIA